ncbi:site-specific tyrosine recombinase [Treponema sp.]
MQDRSLLEGYRSRLIAFERRSHLTLEAYVTEIRIFFRYLDEQNLSLENLVSADLALYLQYRGTEQGLDSRSIAKAVSVLRSFFRYIIDEGLRLDDPAVALERPRSSRRLPAVLSRDTVDALLATVDMTNPRGIRDRALFELVYSAGLRISEVVSLDLSDIFFSESLARVRGKGSKERLVPFGGEAASYLHRYLEEARPSLAKARRSPALFISRNGKRLSRKGIWKNYATLASLSGTSSKLHTLRHSYATELLAGGADLRSVQELLGHADLSTTQIYTHVDADSLRANHRRYLPNLGERA